MRRLLPGLPWLSAITAVVIVVGGFLAARSETVQALLGRWSFVKSVTNDNSTYYRLKVKLAYKGEPQDFDIVVGCNVHQIIYKDNSRTYEAGLIPTVFGRRMSDGKALVVRPPKACRGETTANGRVQPDLLPLIIVYDNADALEFGIAYLSEDAYTSPLSVLKFGGATIEEATRSDFDHFRKTQANAVRRELYHSALDSDQLLRQLQLKRGPRTWAHVCEGYERYLLGDGGRSLLREHWPEGQPKYWQASYAVEDALGKWSSIGELRFIRTAPIVLPTLHGRSAMARPISGFRHELVVVLCPHLEDTDLRKHTTPRRATIARIDGRPRMSKGGTTSQDWTTSRTCASSLKEVALEDLPTASAAPFLTTS